MNEERYSKWGPKVSHIGCTVEGTKDLLQIIFKEDGGIEGYCWRCGTTVPNPLEGQSSDAIPKAKKKRSEKEISQEIQEISQFPCLSWDDRKLTEAGMAYFGVRTSVSETDGSTPTAYYLPYTGPEGILGYKVRFVNKKDFIWLSYSHKGIRPFGWEQAIATGSKKLFITEGEFDAIAFWEISKQVNAGTEYENFNPAVISVPYGCGNAARFLSRWLNDIKERFEEVILLFDMDEPGNKAVEDVNRIIPNAKRAILQCKDANECLVRGFIKNTYYAAVTNAKVAKNTKIMPGIILHESGKTQPEHGMEFPWPAFTKDVGGWRFKETSYWGAAPKLGKGEIRNDWAAFVLKKYDFNVFIISPEETPKKTYQLVAGKVAHRIFHDPRIDFDMEAYEKAGDLLRNRLFILDSYQEVRWDSVKSDIRHAIKGENCKLILIDPITNFTNGLASSTANEELQTIATDAAKIAMDLDAHIAFYCHLRKPDAGPQHNRGGKVLEDQFAGSRAMHRSCHQMFGLEGNTDPDLDEKERNQRKVICLADREFGSTASTGLFWNKENGSFTEIRRSSTVL